MKHIANFSLSAYLADASHSYHRVGQMAAPSPPQVLEHRHIGAYVLGLQVIGASLLACVVSIAIPYILPLEGKSALRNLLASTLAGVAALSKPVLLSSNGSAAVHQPTPPLRHLFKSLRNAVPFILLAWVVEACLLPPAPPPPPPRSHLARTQNARRAQALMMTSCVAHEHEIGVLRHSAMVILFCAVFVASCVRALYPMRASDMSVCTSLVCLLGLVTCPQTQFWEGNPLAKQLSFADGGVRFCRVLLFTGCYVAVVLSATPIRVFDVDPLVLSVRAFAACAWLLCCPPPILCLGPLFATVLCLRRVHLSDESQETHTSNTESRFDEDDEVCVQTRVVPLVAPLGPFARVCVCVCGRRRPRSWRGGLQRRRLPCKTTPLVLAPRNLPNGSRKFRTTENASCWPSLTVARSERRGGEHSFFCTHHPTTNRLHAPSTRGTRYIATSLGRLCK